MRGGAHEESAYDGRKLVWTVDARKALKPIPDQYQKRRVKARIEKFARIRFLNTITLETAQKIIQEEMTGLPLDQDTRDAIQKSNESSKTNVGLTSDELKQGLKLVIRDAKGNPLKSVFPWSEEATTRILRIPNGFMRDKVQERVEALALDQKSLTIDLDLVEAGVEIGRQMMSEMLTTMQKEVEHTHVDSVETTPEERAQNLNEVGVLQHLNQRRSEIILKH